MTDRYRLDPNSKVLAKDNSTRDVIQWDDGVAFRCPCGERTCYAKNIEKGGNHLIAFSEDGILTLHPSFGYGMDSTENRCHFWLENGIPRVLPDSTCKGKHLA